MVYVSINFYVHSIVRPSRTFNITIVHNVKASSIIYAMGKKINVNVLVYNGAYLSQSVIVTQLCIFLIFQNNSIQHSHI